MSFIRCCPIGRVRPARLWLAVVALAFALPVPSQAQERAGVAGRVAESDGAAIVGATITVEGTGLGAFSDEAGRFRIEGLAPGSYRLRIERLGYRTRTITVSLSRGETADLTIELTPQPFELRGLTVIGTREELAEIRERLRRVPGSVQLIEPADIRSTRQANFKDVLRFTPGVYVQPRFGAADESQLSIRGSGLRNNFHLRGVNLLVNGMPYRNADGFTDFESLELLTAENIQVYKGANALRYGGSTLGGAINIETKTGYSADPLQLFVQGGAYGFGKAQVSTGDVFDRFNYYASYAHTRVGSFGGATFRQFADQRRDRANAHVGYTLSPTVDARLFYFFAHVDENLPGSLTRDEFEQTPRAAAPENLENRWGRDYSLHHVGLQLRAQLGPGQRLDIAPYGQFRDIVHPIFQVLDQQSGDVGLEARYENTAGLAGRENRLTIGAWSAYGRIDNRHFENVGGARGELRKDQLDEAVTLALYAEDALELASGLTGVLGFRYDRSMRSIEDDFLEDGDQSDERWFQALLPRFGVIYELSPDGDQLYANASRFYEPPLLLELNSLTVPGFVDLDPQEAWQFEIGSRGSSGDFRWDLAAYDIELRDEIININVQPFPGADFTVPTYRNVPRSRHYGLETGLRYRLPGSVLTGDEGGDRLAGRVSYTLGRFEYVDDPDFEGNEIPGAPEHVIQAELSYTHPVGFNLRPNLEWVPGRYFVNSGNTAVNDGWFVLGLRGEWEFPQHGAGVFMELRNLTDELYAPAVTVDDAAGRFFQPADGRSLYAGLRWRP